MLGAWRDIYETFIRSDPKVLGVIRTLGRKGFLRKRSFLSRLSIYLDFF